MGEHTDDASRMFGIIRRHFQARLTAAIVDDAREKSWSHCSNEAHHLLLVSLFFLFIFKWCRSNHIL